MSQATRGREMLSQRRVSGEGACDHPPPRFVVLATVLRDRDLAGTAGVGASYGGGESELDLVLPATSGVAAADAERVETIFFGLAGRG